jgi:hypothetical protein
MPVLPKRFKPDIVSCFQYHCFIYRTTILEYNVCLNIIVYTFRVSDQYSTIPCLERKVWKNWTVVNYQEKREWETQNGPSSCGRNDWEIWGQVSRKYIIYKINYGCLLAIMQSSLLLWSFEHSGPITLYACLDALSSCCTTCLGESKLMGYKYESYEYITYISRRVL